MRNIIIDELAMVFYDCEFDIIMSVLEKLTEIVNTQFKNNRDEIIDSIKETKEKILKNSFFDTENKQVYINLSGDEWTHIIQGLIVCSAYCSFEKEPIPSFQDMISKDTTRIWKTE